jgi:choline dehydrogenase-like flavoprotein
MGEIAEVAGFTITNEDTELAPGRSIHEVGTARMGTSRSTSVLDSTCRAWDVPNLFVMDGACFVSSGHQNPTLTMMAIADRACDALLAQWRTGH